MAVRDIAIDYSKGQKPNILFYLVEAPLHNSLFLKQAAFEERFDRMQTANQSR